MTEPLVLVAFALLVLGVVGSVTPVVPGAPLSIVGVYLYWWNSGYAEPGALLLVVLTFVGLLAMGANLLAGLLSTRSTGVPKSVVVLAVLVGSAGFVLAGLVGFLIGVAGTVFVATLVTEGDVIEGGKAAIVTVLAIFSSGVVELLLTGSMLVAMTLVAL